MLRSPFARAADFPPFPFPVLSDRLTIRPFGERDLGELASLLCELQGTLLPTDFMKSEARQLLVQINSRDSTDLTMGMFRDENVLVGRMSATAHDMIGASDWELGYYAMKAHRKSGYVSEAIEALKPVFRDAMDARGFAVTIKADNVDSLRVMERTRFREIRALQTGHRSFRFDF